MNNSLIVPVVVVGAPFWFAIFCYSACCGGGCCCCCCCCCYFTQNIHTHTLLCRLCTPTHTHTHTHTERLTLFFLSAYLSLDIFVVYNFFFSLLTKKHTIELHSHCCKIKIDKKEDYYIRQLTKTIWLSICIFVFVAAHTTFLFCQYASVWVSVLLMCSVCMCNGRGTHFFAQILMQALLKLIFIKT